MLPRFAFALAIFAGVGCLGSPEGPISANDYDRTCETDADCVLVSEGDLCGCRVCGNAAIASSDLSRWESDSAACDGPQRQSCFSLEPRTVRQASSCETLYAMCVAGVCQAVDPYVLPADCTADADCETVPGHGIGCGPARGVNALGADLARRLWETASSSPRATCAGAGCEVRAGWDSHVEEDSPEPCDCNAPPAAVCDRDVCRVESPSSGDVTWHALYCLAP